MKSKSVYELISEKLTFGRGALFKVSCFPSLLRWPEYFTHPFIPDKWGYQNQQFYALREGIIVVFSLVSGVPY